MIEEAITALFLGNSGVAAQLGTRVHWQVLPAGVTGMPYCRLQVIGGAPRYHSTGESGITETLLQADIYAETATAKTEAARAVEVALSAYRDVIAGVDIRAIYIDTMRDLDERTEGEGVLFRRNITFRANWRTV